MSTDAAPSCHVPSATGPGPTDAPAIADVPSWKLLLTLAGGGAIVGLAIVLIYQWTLPTIEAYKANVLRGAIAEVLHAPARCDTLYRQGDALVAERPAGDAGTHPERVFLGYDKAGAPIGFAMEATQVGFSDPIELIVGYDSRRHKLLGMKILVSKETPGIADKIELPPFTGQFTGVVAPVTGIKADQASRKAATDIVMITGATISSRAVIKGVNKAVTQWQPLLDKYMAAHAGRN